MRVVWEIDVDADTPEAAAARALKIQRDRTSTATVFSVMDEKGVSHHIDLGGDEADEAADPRASRRWVCPTCGEAGQLEVLAWTEVATDTVTDWADPADFWCPDCELHFDHVCEVDDAGHCHMHDQPQDRCRRENRPPEAVVP